MDDALATATEQYKNTVYITIVAATIVWWDVVVTIDAEVQFVWRAKNRWTLVNLAFALNRWCLIVVGILQILVLSIPNPTPHLCFAIFRSGIILKIAAITGIQALLYIRVWALYDRTRVMTIILTIGAIITTMVNIVGFLPFMANIGLTIVPFIPGCVVVPTTSTGLIFGQVWVYATMAAETILFTMTITKALRMSRGTSRSQLLSRLITTGSFYYAVALVCIALAVTSDYVGGTLIIIVQSSVTLSVLSTVSSRLVFSLRDVVYGDNETEEREYSKFTPINILLFPNEASSLERHLHQ